MKTYTIPRFIIVFFAFALFSFVDPYMIKRISDKDFRYEFYTTDKKIEPKITKTYYWFKGGLIHEAQGGIAGDLLNDKFIKMYHSNQLAEQGQFKNGLRVGEWKTWYSNGTLATTLNYRKGLKSGKYFRYNEIGTLVEHGKYSSNLKTGRWTNTDTKEITTYRNGIIVKQKETFTKSEKYRIKQENIKLENAQGAQKELEATSDAMKLASYKAKTKEEKAIASKKAKTEKEAKIAKQKIEKATEKATKKAAREQAKNEPKKDSKVKTFFNNLFKKKDKAPK
ncbi:toxin-antitoxin system YwqK family antitoxin [Flavobacterium sp. FlaQc-48]|uniref:toxin-antitoxin system YwqK family antitoxin n=1 Tax=Flavobacterium sp. FlaQc-48 TaxID=3374181 RepID=UPI0037579F15